MRGDSGEGGRWRAELVTPPTALDFNLPAPNPSNGHTPAWGVGSVKMIGRALRQGPGEAAHRSITPSGARDPALRFSAAWPLIRTHAARKPAMGQGAGLGGSARLHRSGFDTRDELQAAPTPNRIGSALPYLLCLVLAAEGIGCSQTTSNEISRNELPPVGELTPCPRPSSLPKVTPIEEAFRRASANCASVPRL